MNSNTSPIEADPDFSPANERSPFSLENDSGYQQWRQQKLELRQQHRALTVYPLDINRRLTDLELIEIGAQVRAHNYFCFDTDAALSREQFLQLNQFFGLRQTDQNAAAESDSVSLLQVAAASDPRAAYIPYTSRALNWHTDGYYNPPQRSIRAFSLFCKQTAESGGENFLLDHEWVYLLMRDSNPDLLAALMSPQMMSVPANTSAGKFQRAKQSGPVFSVDADSGALNMRYSSRPRNMVWKQDPISQRALQRLLEIMRDSDAVTEIGLDPGQGLICNNILHGRREFRDSKFGEGRQLYRARYHDAIALGTNRVLA